jgi:hypothetical protein
MSKKAIEEQLIMKDSTFYEQLRSGISPTDWQTLEAKLNEEQQLDSLRKKLLANIEELKKEMGGTDWEQKNTRQKCEHVYKMQQNLYDLQLVEHAAKKPLLEIGKILFAANSTRCVRREASPGY